MNKTSATVVMCALGLAAGYAAHRQVPDGGKSANAAAVAKPAKQDLSQTTAAEKTQAIQLPRIRSDETLESLIAQGGKATYAGLALWLVDASGPDIAAYWESHRNNALNGDSNGDLRRLIFYNWTRVDPKAAISATAGTKWASDPWSAWGAVDPQAALAAAGPEQMKSVAGGIGQMQPEWLREHFDQIPEEARRNALNGLMTWKEDSDHVARLDFLMAQGMGFNPAAFKTLARKDPWAAGGDDSVRRIAAESRGCHFRKPARDRPRSRPCPGEIHRRPLDRRQAAGNHRKLAAGIGSGKGVPDRSGHPRCQPLSTRPGKTDPNWQWQLLMGRF